jgi:hypothetical protein
MEVDMSDLIDEPDFKIDPSLRDLLPAGTSLETELLEIQLLASGGPESDLVVWDEQNVLIDGHRRYEICKRVGLPYTIVRKSFESKEAVVNWMLTNQIGRRNLLDHDKSVFTSRLVKAVAWGLPKVEATEKVAEMIGQSTRTTYRQLEYADAYAQLPQEWQLAISSRDVKCPHKYVPRIAGLPRKESIELLDDVLETGSVEPIQKMFPDKPSKARVIKQTRASASGTPKATSAEQEPDDREVYDPDSPDVMNVDKRAGKETLIGMIQDSEAAVDMASRLIDTLFGADGLNASESSRKREADSHVRGINIVLKDVRRSL